MPMPASDKITILLADEDALRRDGLAAVLQGTAQHEIVAQCGDGEEALGRIRALRPQVAVVDLNLPKVHGIELVRRVRSEGLGTKIVILSGTANDEIVREVVRAGGDGYLLKNGPARHLVDAISYVRDGGQYFSPQLGRDGRERHLLEETPRPASAAGADQAGTIEAEGAAGDEDAGRVMRGSRYGRPRKTPRRGEGGRMRERIQGETGAENLEERDYEILDMMADGIRPILDRLDEIDARVGQMETGAAPVRRMCGAG
jgi:DNA-binding NarL/FixJ family response regulator